MSRGAVPARGRCPARLALALLLGATVLAGPPAGAADSRPSTVADPRRFETFELVLPRLEATRTVRVYLPPGYAGCRGCRYPVLYFLDGQNLFDAATSFAGEWQADETLDALYRAHGLAFIAVAIDHGGGARVQELSVWENPRFAPARGEAFLDDLVAVVKPAIEARYRTRRDAASTTIAGSSMGALMAQAALLRHPESFGRGLLFSPSWWFSPAIATEAAQRALQPGQRTYVMVGTAEGGTVQADARAMVERWRARLPEGAAIEFVEQPGAGHTEASWAAALPAALCWLQAGACTDGQGG